MFQYILMGISLFGMVMVIYSIWLFDKFQRQLEELCIFDDAFHSKAVNGYRYLLVIFVIGYFLEFISALFGNVGVDSRIVIGMLLFFGAVFVVRSIRFQGRLMKAVIYARMQQIDELTGVLNKNAFESKVSLAMKGQENAYLLVMDLDNFKSINDTCGHMAGDTAIKKAATLLRDAFHEEDVVARFGGDEFVVYLRDWENDDLIRTLNQINEELQMWSRNRFEGVSVSFSMGVAKQGNIEEYTALFNKADKAMYAAKENGKACYYNGMS